MPKIHRRTATWIRTLLLLLALASAGPALAHHLDLVQEQERFRANDAELNLVWAQVREELPGERFAGLLESQRAWIGQRDAFAQAVAAVAGGFAPGDEEAVAEFWWARAVATVYRTEYLRAWLNSFGPHGLGNSHWEGVWVDGWGGRLLVRGPEGDRLHFRLQVVRGPTAHLGELQGVAAVAGGVASFSTTLPQGLGEATATFVLEGPGLTLTTDNAHYFHGARAYFDGVYVRLQDWLDPADAAALAASGGEADIFAVAARGTPESMERLLARDGGLVDSRDEEGASPLMIAAAESDDPAVLSLLLAAGASHLQRDARGDSALHYAARNPDPRFAALLLAAGAEPDAANAPFGLTALMVAAQAGNSRVIAALLAAGADPDLRDRELGRTALMHAAARERQAAIDALLTGGADATLRQAYPPRLALELIPEASGLRGTDTYWRLNDASYR